MKMHFENGTFPIRLQDHERADLLVDISNHAIEQLEDLGVIDAEGRQWGVEAKEIQRFIHVAKMHQLPKPDHPKNEPDKPSEVKIMANVACPSHDGSKCLEIKLKNLGPYTLNSPFTAKIEWEYKPPRQTPIEIGEPHYSEIGGSISLKLAKSCKTLEPNDELTFFLISHDPLTQPIVAVLASDIPDDCLRVIITASRWQWTATGENIPEVLRDFARVVLHNVQ